MSRDVRRRRALVPPQHPRRVGGARHDGDARFARRRRTPAPVTCGSRSAPRSATWASPVRAAVMLTGAGGNFCTGADLSGSGGSGGESSDGPPETMVDAMRVLADAVLAIHGCPVPVIAKVEGLCVGAGLGLSLAADLAWCADGRPVLGHLRQAGPEPRLRHLVAAAPADRRAQGQGAGLHRRGC